MLSKKGKQKDVKKTREEKTILSEENKGEEERLNEREDVKSGLFKIIVSFFQSQRLKRSNLLQSPEEDNATAESDLQGVKVGTEHDRVEAGHDGVEAGPSTIRQKLWTRRKSKPQSAGVTIEDAGTFKKHLLEASVAGSSVHGESEGYGSYFMPCCPCSGHLNDQPCMPQWCCSYKYIDWLTVVILIFCFSWGTVYAVNAETASPNGALFTLVLASIFAYAAGFISAYFMKIPPMLFMLIVGFIFINSPIWTNSAHFGVMEVEAVTAFTLTIMSTKAALYFDGKIFMKHALTISLLGIVPCAGEILTVGGVLYAICGLDLATSFSTATVLANVSSVMISHSLVTLADAGYGARSGILSILMAAAPINGLIVLGALGILFQDARIGLAGALITLGEQLGGVVAGALVGAILAFLPHRNNINATLQRIIMHILSIMCVQLLCQTLGAPSLGHLFNTAAACATVNCLSLKKWTIEVMMLKDTFEMIWHGLQPVAVIFACSMIDFAKMNVHMIWQSFFVFFVSYIVRVSLVYLSTHFSEKTIKQRVFMSLCWTARGLTQGILATSLIAFVKKKSSPQQTLDVITIFTVNLIVGNVIGALQIWFLGPKLLPRNERVSDV